MGGGGGGGREILSSYYKGLPKFITAKQEKKKKLSAIGYKQCYAYKNQSSKQCYAYKNQSLEVSKYMNSDLFACNKLNLRGLVVYGPV